MTDFAGASLPGPRPYNEDSYLVVDLSPSADRLSGMLAFVMVSDGMGGHAAGDVASRVAVDAAKAYIDAMTAAASTTPLVVTPEVALREITLAAARAVSDAAAERGVESMGATLVAAFVTADAAWYAHLGDSRAYLLTGTDATQLTVDHSAVGRMIAEGVLTEEQAQHHPSRNVIERALGFSDGSDVEIGTVALPSGGVLMLCSDGLSTVLTGADMRDIVFSSRGAEVAAKRLVREAVEYGSDDNATAVVWSAQPLRRASATIPGIRRRSNSAAGRQAKRHSRAQRATYVIGGVMILAMLGVFAAAAGLIGGGGGAAPVATGSVVATLASTPASELAGGKKRQDPETAVVQSRYKAGQRVIFMLKSEIVGDKNGHPAPSNVVHHITAASGAKKIVMEPLLWSDQGREVLWLAIKWSKRDGRQRVGWVREADVDGMATTRLWQKDPSAEKGR